MYSLRYVCFIMFTYFHVYEALSISDAVQLKINYYSTTMFEY